MSFPDTTNQTPRFIEDSPDFSKPINLDQVWVTEIMVARNGGEQRASRRFQPLYRLGYATGALSPAEFTLRRARSIREIGAPVVVPIWVNPISISSIAANQFDPSIGGLSPYQRKFKINGYCYFVETGKVSTFRLITGVTSGTVNLHATIGSPPPTFPTFTTAAVVYPCIFGTRTNNGIAFDLVRVDSTDETFSIEEL